MKDTGHFVDFLVLGDLLVAEMGLGHGGARCIGSALHKPGHSPSGTLSDSPYTKVLFEICIHAALKLAEERTVFDMGTPIWQIMSTKAMNGLQQARRIHISFPRDTPDDNRRHQPE
jgi:hypothetical protein